MTLACFFVLQRDTRARAAGPDLGLAPACPPSPSLPGSESAWCSARNSGTASIPVKDSAGRPPSLCGQCPVPPRRWCGESGVKKGFLCRCQTFNLKVPVNPQALRCAAMVRAARQAWAARTPGRERKSGQSPLAKISAKSTRSLRVCHGRWGAEGGSDAATCFVLTRIFNESDAQV